MQRRYLIYLIIGILIIGSLYVLCIEATRFWPSCPSYFIPGQSVNQQILTKGEALNAFKNYFYELYNRTRELAYKSNAERIAVEDIEFQQIELQEGDIWAWKYVKWHFAIDKNGTIYSTMQCL